MKKLLVFTLLVTGWILAIYQLEYPLQKTIYRYVEKHDFGESYTVELHGEYFLSLHRTSKWPIWVMDTSVTMAQFEQFQLNYPEKIYFHASEEDEQIAAGMKMKDIRAFCQWLNQMETQKGNLPDGYEFSSEFEHIEGYILPDNAMLASGSPIRLSQKDDDIQQTALVSLYENLKLVCLGPLGIAISIGFIFYQISKSLRGERDVPATTSET